MVVLPIRPGIPDQTFKATLLDNTVYSFRLLWNERARVEGDEPGARTGMWYLDIMEENGDPIIMGCALVIGAYLGRTSTHPLLREGVFAARDLTQDLKEAGLDDVGVRVEVWYFTRDEAAQEIMASVTRSAL